MAWLKKMLERRAETDDRVREILETFEQRDKARGDSSVPLAELDVPEQPLSGKRKSRDVEAESPGATPSPRQSEERQLKKPRSTITRESQHLVSRTKQSQASGAQPAVDETTIGSTQLKHKPLPQHPDAHATDPQPLPQLDTTVLPSKPHTGNIGISRIGSATREELFDTGLLTPRDLKSEPPEL